MKAVILNGSPRQGNTVTAIEALKRGMKDIEVTEIVTTDADVAPCLACGWCENVKGCIADDDTNRIVKEAVDADILIFATPVYYWGITAQLKLVIDKFFSVGSKLSGKKAGFIVIGEDTLDGPQYPLIAGQFKCIAEYLNWDIAFSKSYSAAEPGDLAADSKALAELEALGAAL